MSGEQTPKKPTSKFGSIADQFGTIGSKPSIESKTEETASSQEVKTAKLSAVKISKSLADEEKGQQTVRLPLSLRKWLRIRAAVEERDLSEIVTQALEEYRTKVEG